MEINDFAQMNWTRAITSNSGDHDPFDSLYYAIGMGGEAGEAVNLVKKHMRGDFKYEKYMEGREKLIEETVDTITYAFLVLMALNVSVEEEILKKYEKVNRRLEAGGFDKRPENDNS